MLDFVESTVLAHARALQPVRRNLLVAAVLGVAYSCVASLGISTAEAKTVKPQAAWSVSDSTPSVGQRVTLDASSSAGKIASPGGYTWTVDGTSLGRGKQL